MPVFPGSNTNVSKSGKPINGHLNQVYFFEQMSYCTKITNKNGRPSYHLKDIDINKCSIKDVKLKPSVLNANTNHFCTTPMPVKNMALCRQK